MPRYGETPPHTAGCGASVEWLDDDNQPIRKMRFEPGREMEAAQHPIATAAAFGFAAMFADDGSRWEVEFFEDDPSDGDSRLSLAEGT